MNVEPQTGNRKPRLEVRGKLRSKTLYSLEERSRKIGHCSWSKRVKSVKVYREFDSAKTTNNK